MAKRNKTLNYPDLFEGKETGGGASGTEAPKKKKKKKPYPYTYRPKTESGRERTNRINWVTLYPHK